jgi:outer membrane protein assembly factor BamB
MMPSVVDDGVRRRIYLAALASATAGSIAGCSGGGDGDGGDGGDGGGDGAADTDAPPETDAPDGTDADATDAAGEGEDPGTGTTLAERWRVGLDLDTVGRVSYWADATADGVVVANRGGVYSLTAGGDERWHWTDPTSFERPGFADVTTRGETVFAAAAREGVIAALDAGTGDVLWRRDRDRGSAQPRLAAVPVGDYLATTVLDPALSVLDPANGETVTEFAAVSPITGFGYDGTLVVAGAGSTVGYDPETGEELWRADDVQILAQAGLAGNVMIGGGDGQFVGVDLDAGERIWTAEHPEDAFPAIVGGGGHVVAQWGTRNGTVRGIAPADGSTAWETSVSLRTVPFMPVLSDDAVVVDGSNGYVALDADDGTDLGSATVTGTSGITAAASADTFYACGLEVVAYDL